MAKTVYVVVLHDPNASDSFEVLAACSTRKRAKDVAREQERFVDDDASFEIVDMQLDQTPVLITE